MASNKINREMNSTRKLPQPTARELNAWIDVLFEPIASSKEPKGYLQAVTAFQNLTGYFFFWALAGRRNLFRELISTVHFDHVGLIEVLTRFQRDTYGVHRFHEFTQALVDQGRMDEKTEREIRDQLINLGLPVASPRPAKTTVAASFSMWMCVFRPVSIRYEKSTLFPLGSQQTFCAALNFFLASTFLLKFGEIDVGSPEEKVLFLTRTRNILTYQRPDLASLQILYRGIFRARSTAPKATPRNAKRQAQPQGKTVEIALSTIKTEKHAIKAAENLFAGED